MCGLAGVVTSRMHRLGVTEAELCAMRDRLAHRGPDGSGVWVSPNAALVHRRLAILDPTDRGHQPMQLGHDGPVLVYNGEIYNDTELRCELERPFLSGCDTETLARALEAWGVQAIDRLRGMYAFAWHDPARHCLLLARDPLGVKPLYIWRGSLRGVPAVAFASEIPALFEIRGIDPRPDMAGVSAYLTTIRTVNGARTMFEGIQSLLPGQVVEVDLAGQAPVLRTVAQRDIDRASSPESCREVMTQSVQRHLRTDVPLCAMLSGGLDSSVICSIAAGELNALSTYAAGSDHTTAQLAGQADDVAMAEHVATALGTRHTTVHLDEGLFVRTWAQMLGRMGVPLSTPNETAIHLICAAMKAQGCSVTLSGEGADELLGGYESPMASALAHVHAGNDDPGLFQLASNAWCPLDIKAQVLTSGALGQARSDGELINHYRALAEVCAERTTDALAAHLQFHRRVNLTGLLGRLDTASMLASVEGRVPFADVRVAAWAESLPMSERYDQSSPWRTKVALRRAFAELLPEQVIRRPKASFPLPFQQWLGAAAARLSAMPWIREIVSPEALLLIEQMPSVHWRLAWPVLNVALWGERWWGTSEVPDLLATTDCAAMA